MWLFLATANLALWHGVLSHRIGINDSLLITAMYWLVALFLLWKKRDQIKVSPQPLASTIGFLILGWALLRGMSVFWFENSLVQLLPVIGFVAIILIGSGWNSFRVYFPSLFTLFTFSVIGSLIELFFKSNPGGFDFAKLTAQASTFLLHYIGFDVVSEDVYIYLSQGSVEVLYFCTGGPLISLLFQLTLVLVLVTPIRWKLLFNLLLSIVGIGFFLGVIRVALLAVVVSDQAAFDYWHGSEGNQIFSLIAFSIWIIAVNFIYENHDHNLSSPPLSSEEEHPQKSSTSPQEASATTFSLTSPSSWFLSITSVMMMAVTIATFIMPEIGRREIQPLQFPPQMNLSGWTEEKSIPLVNQPETKLRFERLRSGREYHYQQQEAKVTAALRFSSPTVGRLENYIKQTYPESLTTAYQQGNTRYIPNRGNYHLFQDDEKAYLSACLTPTGESTVDFTNYVNKANRNMFEWQTLIPRLLGQKSFRERRCLWVNLSTPLNPDLPETSYKILESVFKTGYPQWQGLFENQ
ncbi:MAG: cyanoexosortase A system-associated protein [Halothece sp. Uz-M2-17]|nr:cyanoexosortase A system-associated protein [Halothece sp. Uz-M2-17]